MPTDWRQLLDDVQVDHKWVRFSWVSLRALLSSANDLVGKGAPRLVNDIRRAWMEGVDPDTLVVSWPGATKFLVLGDPGEQDVSQYAVVPQLLMHQDVDLMIIMSDVIYPAGSINDYVDGFYIPYQDFEPPIFALPGNHDWYDGLRGFMYHFCERPKLPKSAYKAGGYSFREQVYRLFWQRGKEPRKDMPARRPAPACGRQPGPYYAIDTGELLIVCIDTGIKGEIDATQAKWLIDVSERHGDQAKVLLTGKPLVVNAKDDECRIAWDSDSEVTRDTRFNDVHAIVKKFGYVAAIGGDVHNYQRYRDGSAPEHYIVSGGGGAYMGATHPIPAVGPGRMQQFPSYPTRAESVTFFGVELVPRMWRLVKGIVATLLGIAIASAAVLTGPADPSLFGVTVAATVAIFVFLAFASHRGAGALRIVLGILIAGAAAAGAFFGARHLGRSVSLADWEDWLRYVLVGAAGAVAAWLGLIGLGVGEADRESVPGWRRAVSLVMSFVFGIVLALAGWWLAPDQFGPAVGAAAACAALGALVARGLRATHVWQKKWVQAVVYALQAVLAAGILWVWPAEEVRPELYVAFAVLGLMALVPVINGFVLRKGLPWLVRSLSEAAAKKVERGLIGISPFVALAIVAVETCGFRAWVHEPALRRVAATVVCVPIVLVLGVWLVYRVRDKLPRPAAYKTVLVIVAAGIGLVIVRLELVAPWANRAAVASVVIVAVVLLGVVIAHLTFLGAYALLYRPRARLGVLESEEADAIVKWRLEEDSPAPADPGVRLIGSLVHPGVKDPHGPLQKLIAEIFDRDHPPFHKSFLRLDVADGDLVIRCYAATGCEAPGAVPAEKDRVVIPL